MEQTKEPRVGVGILLVDRNGRVLLTLRKRPPERDCWSIVGGKVDPFETLEDCAKREAYEEVGVQIEIERLLCVTDHVVRNENQHWVAPAFLCRSFSGEVENREPEKTERVEWFAMDALPENLTLTAKNAIRAYLTA